jgi:hypothetical protein
VLELVHIAKAFLKQRRKKIFNQQLQASFLATPLSPIATQASRPLPSSTARRRQGAKPAPATMFKMIKDMFATFRRQSQVRLPGSPGRLLGAQSPGTPLRSRAGA